MSRESLWTPDANKQAMAIAADIDKMRREDRQHIAKLARAMLPPGPRLEAFLVALAKSSTHHSEAPYPKGV